jgi:predicted RNA-binding protein YlxR (DUF448 family)
MCVGCRETAGKADLLRVVAIDGMLSPDPRARYTGRGAYLHLNLGCLDSAEHRRAFPRALRAAGSLDPSVLRAYLVNSRPREQQD